MSEFHLLRPWWLLLLLLADRVDAFEQHVRSFATLRPDGICAVCQPGNTPSATVMERLGMTFTGLGRWYDMDCKRYDITAAQWAASPAKARYDAEA